MKNSYLNGSAILDLKSHNHRGTAVSILLYEVFSLVYLPGNATPMSGRMTHLWSLYAELAPPLFKKKDNCPPPPSSNLYCESTPPICKRRSFMSLWTLYLDCVFKNNKDKNSSNYYWFSEECRNNRWAEQKLKTSGGRGKCFLSPPQTSIPFRIF